METNWSSTLEKDSNMAHCIAVLLPLLCHAVIASMNDEPPMRQRLSFKFKEPYVVRRGEDFDVTCVPVGSLNMTVEWIQATRGSLEGIVSPREMNILQLRNIQQSENYTCVVESKEHGRIERTIIITVQDLPFAPVDVVVDEETESSVRLSWSYPSAFSNVTPNEVKHYVIQYKPVYPIQTGVFQLDTNQAEIYGITERHYTIQQLNHSTEYEIYVLAANLLGKGPVSPKTLACTTGP
ncbi:unnamed protein product, partial [Darwinula stevensoni]